MACALLRAKPYKYQWFQRSPSPRSLSNGGIKILGFQKYARRLRNTHNLHALGNLGCELGAIWAVVIWGCHKKTHCARGIRVFHPHLDFETCELGGVEIWVPQEYARRSRNTRFPTLPRCNLWRPGGCQNLGIPGIGAAPEEYVFF